MDRKIGGMYYFFDNQLVGYNSLTRPGTRMVFDYPLENPEATFESFCECLKRLKDDIEIKIEVSIDNLEKIGTPLDKNKGFDDIKYMAFAVFVMHVGSEIRVKFFAFKGGFSFTYRKMAFVASQLFDNSELPKALSLLHGICLN